MLFAEEIRGIVKTILSQDELLSFERVLESAPEVYDYSGVMTDEQLNHLIAFLSRNKENIFLELTMTRCFIISAKRPDWYPRSKKRKR